MVDTLISLMGDVVSSFVAVIFGVLTQLLAILLYPFNALMFTFMPDFSDQITSALNNFFNIFSNITWFLSLLPRSLILTLVFVFSFRITIYTSILSTQFLLKAWNVIQKIKFW